MERVMQGHHPLLPELRPSRVLVLPVQMRGFSGTMLPAVRYEFVDEVS